MEDTKADFTMTFRELSEITADQLKELHIPEVWIQAPNPTNT